jgi:CBS domain-containing protein
MLLGADLGMSITGEAGPDPEEDVPVGTIFVGMADSASARVFRTVLSGEPEEIGAGAAHLALSRLEGRVGDIRGFTGRPTRVATGKGKGGWIMKVREIMTEAPRVVGEGESIRKVAAILADDQIGAVIVCNDEKRLQGLITDRDIATQVVARGMDADATAAGELLDGSEVITIGADDTVEVAIETMKQHAVRRLPVVDGVDLVGIVSQADLASHAAEAPVGGMVEAISRAPDNTGRG